MPKNKKKTQAAAAADQQELQMLTVVGPAEEWIVESDPQSFKADILPLLLKVVDCHPTKAAYRIIDDDTTTVFHSEDLLRQHLCQFGIPRAHLLTADEYARLCDWVRYAHVLKSDFTGSGYPTMTEAQIVNDIFLDALQVSALHDDDEEQPYYYCCAAATDSRRHHRHHKQKLSLEELRVLVRGGGHDEIAPRRCYRGLSPAQKVNLRVWAARSSQPLPRHPTTMRAGEHQQQQQEEGEATGSAWGAQHEDRNVVAAGGDEEKFPELSRKRSPPERPATQQNTKKPRWSLWNVFSFRK